MDPSCLSPATHILPPNPLYLFSLSQPDSPCNFLLIWPTIFSYFPFKYTNNFLILIVSNARNHTSYRYSFISTFPPTITASISNGNLDFFLLLSQMIEFCSSGIQGGFIFIKALCKISQRQFHLALLDFSLLWCFLM